MSKYHLFGNSDNEKIFWDATFRQFFDGYERYEVASKEDDDLYGVDVWVDRKRKPIRIGVQLKTSRNNYVNIHYYMKCSSGWNKQLGINIYVDSPKVDYLIYAYPYDGYAYGLSKSAVQLFWEVYRSQLEDYSLKEYPDFYGGDCWKYYFQVSTDQFEIMCESLDIPFYRRNVGLRLVAK